MFVKYSFRVLIREHASSFPVQTIPMSHWIRKTCQYELARFYVSSSLHSSQIDACSLILHYDFYCFSKHFMIFLFYQDITYCFRNIILIKYIYFVKIFLGATTRWRVGGGSLCAAWFQDAKITAPNLTS